VRPIPIPTATPCRPPWTGPEAPVTAGRKGPQGPRRLPSGAPAALKTRRDRHRPPAPRWEQGHDGAGGLTGTGGTLPGRVPPGCSTYACKRSPLYGLPLP
jgi:hypothetical protein